MAKRRAGIFKIKRSRFYYMHVIEDGKRRLKSTGADVYSEAASVLERVKAGEVIPSASRTPLFRDFAETYLGSLRANRRRPRTIGSARISLKHLIRKLGSRKLHEIRLGHVEEFKAMREEEGVAPATVNRDLTILRAMLNKAVEMGVLQPRPWKVSKLRVEKNRKRVTLTQEDRERLLRAARLGRDRALVNLAAHTGLRLSELLWLTWEDIHVRDDGAGEVVVQGKTDDATGEMWLPKTHERRTVPVSRDMMTALKEHRLSQPPGTKWVFPSSRTGGRFTSPGWQLGKLFKRAGLHQRGIGLHTLRHTAASTWLREGTDIRTVSRLLGHSNIQTTMIYLHTNEELMRRAVETPSLAPMTVGAASVPGEGEVIENKGSEVVKFLVNQPRSPKSPVGRER